MLSTSVFFDNIRVIPVLCSLKICPRHPVEGLLIPRTGIVMFNLFLRNTILYLIYNSSSQNIFFICYVSSILGTWHRSDLGRSIIPTGLTIEVVAFDYRPVITVIVSFSICVYVRSHFCDIKTQGTLFELNKLTCFTK